MVNIKKLILTASKDTVFLSAVIVYSLLMVFFANYLNKVMSVKQFLVSGNISMLGDEVFTSLNRKINATSSVKKDNVVYFKLKVYMSETLSQIALQRSLRLDTIISANRLTELKTLKDNQTLVVPDRDGLVYVAKKGDTIFKVAKIYGIDEEILRNINDLKSDKLYKGQYVFIPKARFKDSVINSYKKDFLMFPVAGVVKNFFGEITNKITKLSQPNDGLDILSTEGSDVYASAYGIVAGGGLHSTYGYYLILSHKNDMQTFYGYLDSINFKKGDIIKQGDVIAKVGKSGISGGNVLRFAVFSKDKAVNPLIYLR